ncbi:MAG: NAD-dependent epimerase/dehydratase family protein [Candidatus Marinimicrobia bacterium]|nr:NAD-dependent epimerase/dehydratase family protein [Candidatus Neomarinimicrobiota bacterium]
MKTCLILGSRGFIGSALAAEAAAQGWNVTAVDRANYAACRGARADILIHAAGNARKYVDEQDPVSGYALSVTSVMQALHDFTYETYVQLSSGAVYPDEGCPARNAEDTALDPARMTRYGCHKWLAEQLVRQYAPRRVILRLGGFVGPGLKKNAVYDLLSGGPLHVHPDSAFQYLDTRDLARLLLPLAAAAPDGETLLNCSARGVVSVRRMAAWAGRALTDADHRQPLVRAELNVARAARLLALPATDETVARFIEAVRRGTLALGKAPRP